MRYPPERKAATREAVLKAAARELRERGFYGVGVDGLSAAAGVTSGAFYSHFSSKEELLASVIDAYLGRPFVAGEGDLATRRERLGTYLTQLYQPRPSRSPRGRMRDPGAERGCRAIGTCGPADLSGAHG